MTLNQTLPINIGSGWNGSSLIKEQRNEGLKERKPKPNFDIDFRLRLSRSRIIEFGIRLRPNRISLFTRIFGRISAIFGTSAELFDFFCSLLKERWLVKFSKLDNIKKRLREKIRIEIVATYVFTGQPLEQWPITTLTARTKMGHKPPLVLGKLLVESKWFLSLLVHLDYCKLYFTCIKRV